MYTLIDVNWVQFLKQLLLITLKSFGKFTLVIGESEQPSIAEIGKVYVI